ncbi:MAG TPA: outer membrane beta-barrel protein [Gallionellaceae bacterium]
MRTTTKFLAAALVSAVMATPAMASEPYVALDIGQTTAKDACGTAGLPAGTTIAGCKDSSAGLRVSLGSEFAPGFSGEVSYAAYGSASLGVATIPGVGTVAGGDWKLSGFQLAGIGALPVNDAFAVIGKVGLASTKISLSVGGLSATSTNLMFGIGAQFRINSDVSVRAQYENLGTVGDAATTGTAKVSVIGAGVVYKF